MTFKVIFIAGVHGVGKGYLSSQVSKVLNLPCYSASELIKNIKKGAVDSDKHVVGAEENQDYLIRALHNLNVSSKYIILDGHFCLYGGDKVIDVPVDTFENIGLQSIVLLKDSVKPIYDRMLERDGNALDVAIIKKLQDNEIERAQYIAKSLKIPLCIKTAQDTEMLIHWVEQQIKGQ